VRILRDDRIDLVHANSNLDSDLFAIVAARLARVPLVSHQRAFGKPPKPLRPLVQLVAASVSISKAIQQDLGSAVKPRRSLVVYNSVELPQAPPEVRPIGTPPRIVSIGRLVRWKGHHVFLEAARKVLDGEPEARFLVAGGPVSPEDRAYEAELREQARALGLGGRLRFLGHVPDLATRIASEFDVVVHASVAPEPFGLVLVEAMAAGRPVVAANKGACPEIVVHGESGLLYEAGDPDALAGALLHLLHTDGLAEKLASGGWDRVREHFNAPREAREIQQIYDTVLRGNAPRSHSARRVAPPSDPGATVGDRPSARTGDAKPGRRD